MLKQSYRSSYHCYTTPSRTSHGKHSSHLYDRARQDLFDNSNTYEYRTAAVPSITTICLLQIQANIIQVLAYLPHHDKAILKQCLRWLLLIGLLFLDNVARLLNVDQEMKDLKKRKKQQDEQDKERDDELLVQPSRLADDEYVYYHGQCTTQPQISEQPLSERTSPTFVKRTQQHLVAPVSPIPTFFPKLHCHGTRKVYTEPSSPVALSPASTVSDTQASRQGSRSSRVGRTASHTRSLSNTMIDKGSLSPQKLRRVTGQREILVENAILPILPRASTSSSSSCSTKQSRKKIINNSFDRSDSSESSATLLSVHGQRPKIQKTVSLSTAQQYHKQVEVNTK